MTGIFSTRERTLATADKGARKKTMAHYYTITEPPVRSKVSDSSQIRRGFKTFHADGYLVSPWSVQFILYPFCKSVKKEINAWHIFTGMP